MDLEKHSRPWPGPYPLAPRRPRRRHKGRRRSTVARCFEIKARPAEGLAGASPLSEKLRTRDSCIAKRRGKVHVGGGATWGAAAAFRFALPDEALPPQNSVRLPTRGPPTVAYVCVYRREKHALSALGVPAQETHF